MAWLQAAPKKHEKDTKPQPRFKTLATEDPVNALPYADEYITKCFGEIGRYMDVGGMSISALSWTEIDSFANRSGFPLTAWESRQLRMMSEKYCAMSSKASDYNYPPPWDAGATYEERLEANRQAVHDKMMAMRQNRRKLKEG